MSPTNCGTIFRRPHGRGFIGGRGGNYWGGEGVIGRGVLDQMTNYRVSANCRRLRTWFSRTADVYELGALPADDGQQVDTRPQSLCMRVCGSSLCGTSVRVTVVPPPSVAPPFIVFVSPTPLLLSTVCCSCRVRPHTCN